MTDILTEDQRLLLGLLLEHNDSDKVKEAYTGHLYDNEVKKYTELAGGNKDVLTADLAAMIAQKAEKDAAKALPALGDSIVAFGRSLGGKAKIVKKESE